MKRERTGSFPVGVNARLQEDRLHVIKRGKRMIATSRFDELLIGVEGRFVLDDRGFEMQKYLFPSFVGAVLRLATRATARGAFFLAAWSRSNFKNNEAIFVNVRYLAWQ
jgi:hypothetical protein